MSTLIRPLGKKDYDAWLPLWNANNQGHIDDELTAVTWERLMDKAAPVFGIGGWMDGKMAGLVHYILHLTTGAIAPVCYMQDVFVAPEQRKKGLARAMVQEVSATGKKEKWGRMYWLTESSNTAAQALYKNIGVKLDFSLFVLPLGKI